MLKKHLIYHLKQSYKLSKVKKGYYSTIGVFARQKSTISRLLKSLKIVNGPLDFYPPFHRLSDFFILIFQTKFNNHFNNDFEVARAYQSLLESDNTQYDKSCILYSTCRHQMVRKRQLDRSVVKIYGHHLALLNHHRLLAVPKTKNNRKIVISHLCGRANCIRGSHLNLESQSLNLDRAACHRSGMCKTHGVHPLCIV